MLHYPRIILQSQKQRIKLCSRPLLMIGALCFFILWVALMVNTLDAWQQRQVLIEERRLQAHAALLSAQLSLSAQLARSQADTPAASSTFILAQPAPLSQPSRSIHPKTGRFITAWLPTSFDAEQARASFEANKDILDEVSPFWYTTRPDDGALIPEQGARDRSLIKAARAADVLVLPTIHNVFDPYAIISLLNNPDLRRRHIAAIIAEVRAYDYDGVDIDYEILPASSRNAYSEFIRELASALHTEGKLLTAAVHAKTEDQGGLGSFQDWALLGELCDRVRIMTYDYHWHGSGPGPIAPGGWVTAVVNYGRTVIPAQKLQVGIPFYGYDWGPIAPATPRTWTEIQALVEQHQPEVNFAASDKSGPIEESWFSYYDQGSLRTVWFADHRSLTAKLALLEEQDLAGIAIWRLGNEDPQSWQIIRQQQTNHPVVLQRMINAYVPDH